MKLINYLRRKCHAGEALSYPGAIRSRHLSLFRGWPPIKVECEQLRNNNPNCPNHRNIDDCPFGRPE